MQLDVLRSRFVEKYGRQARIFRAPGRVNLIGEHTDYNDGFVLPAALDFAAYVAAAARDDRQIRVVSAAYDGEFTFDLDDPGQPAEKSWAKFVQGVAIILEREGHRLCGADLMIDSNVPVGAGLSSSAALEISIGIALASLAGRVIDAWGLARIGQQAEHEFAGVRSGIMDQFASVFGQAGHALFLDCASLEWRPIPVGPAEFLICNTKAKHDLADGEYNRRRQECEQAAAYFGRRALSDVTIEEFENQASQMPENLKRRTRHVITENARVIESLAALKDGDMTRFGRLINESHESLRTDFEVSCAELDTMVELARSDETVMGARMTGGGFGGCTINLMRPGDHSDFISTIAAEYESKTGIIPEIYACRLGNGAAEIS